MTNDNDDINREPKPPYQLDPMSDEQINIYELILSGHNVIGDACAGSGKSTTILSIATHIPNKQFIQLTYNSMLCSEIKTKVDKLALTNLRVYTYHSLVVKYYQSDGYTDTVIRRVLLNKVHPKISIPKFDVLVIDEAQDMTYLYFRLVVKFICDAGSKVQLLILGDYMQGLYEFKGADTRFLTCATDIWSGFRLLSSPKFDYCTLKTSYRVTNQMAAFVNNVMLGETRLEACRDGDPVVYLRRSRYDAEKYVVYKILSLLRDGENPSDFFVLASSIKGQNSAVRRMENALVENGIPCHVPMLENEKIDERVINGKVVFSTFHSVKGRQRKYVFIVGFDQSYFNFFGKNLSQDQCPNTLYVGATRATHGLYLIERHEMPWDRPLTFLHMTHPEMKQQPYIEFKGLPQTLFVENPADTRGGGCAAAKHTHFITPTELIRFIPESVIEEISPLLDTIFIRIGENPTPEEVLDIPILYPTKRGFYEDVSDLNGIAIPAMYFDMLYQNSDSQNSGTMLLDLIEQHMTDVKPNEHSFLKQIIRELPETCITASDYLYVSNVYVAVKEKLYFKLSQIQRDEYNWLLDSILTSCNKRINDTLGFECIDLSGNVCSEIEKTIIHQTNDEQHINIDELLCEYFPSDLFRFTARIDLVTDYCAWELKCTTSITIDHLLQVVIYAWLWRLVIEDIENLENIRDFRIFNIRTGEHMRLEATTEQLTNIMVALLRGKYAEKIVKSDSEFIIECREQFL